MKCEKTTDSDTVTLTLSEDLTLPYAEELKKFLLETAGAGKNVRVKFESVADIDLSLLQLLCSAHRTAVRLKADFTVEGPMPEECRLFVEEAGFIRRHGCRFNEQKKGCLWLEEGCDE